MGVQQNPTSNSLCFFGVNTHWQATILGLTTGEMHHQRPGMWECIDIGGDHLIGSRWFKLILSTDLFDKRSHKGSIDLF